MTATLQRNDYLAFWKKFSTDTSMRSMMLNKNADLLEESDRMDILCGLPDFEDKTVVDIGAGIGRFTTIFAKKAKHVVSADFIESFIEKNQERNAAFSNISYQVTDAVGLQLERSSIDLLFSNWLLMYLNDGEVVDFMIKAMGWLKPGGYLHLRESCTESSTTKSAKGSLHDGTNPTHYRHASVYIQLLREVRWRDESGKLWGLEIEYSHSVPTYIEALSNWRQVHWLARKVPALEGSGVESPLALSFSITQWTILQNHIESMLSEKRSWADKAFGDALAKFKPFRSGSNVLAYSPRMISPFLYVNAHLVVEKCAANVWAVETGPFAYCERLSDANRRAEKRVRLSWSASLNQALLYWHEKHAKFEGFVGTELLLSVSGDDHALENLRNVLLPNSEVLFIEPVLSLEDFEQHVPLIRRHFELISVREIALTDEDQCPQKQGFKLPGQASWLLVHARV